MKRIFIYVLPILAFIFPIDFLSAQSGTCHLVLKGRIVDEHDDSNLEYATIYIQEIKKGISADEEGYYRFEGLCPGRYTLSISHVSCKTREQEVLLNSNKELTLLLEHHALDLETVNVVGKRIEDAGIRNRATIGEEELSSMTGQSLGESLKSIAGVNALQTGPTIAKPVIHGLHSNRILILNNGVRQEGQQWGAEHAPEIDPFVADQLSVVKGAEGVRYGADAIGGIVVMEAPPLMDSAGIHGKVNLVGMSNGRQGSVSAMVQGGTDFGLGWRIQSSVRRSGDARAADYALSNTGSKELNFSGALGWSNRRFSSEIFFSRFNNDLAILRSAHVGNLTDFRNAINSEVPLFVEDFTYKIDNPRQNVRHDLIKAKAVWKIPGHGSLKFQYAIQFDSRDEFDRRRQNNFNRPSISLGLTTNTSQFIWEHSLSDQTRGEIGFSTFWQRNRNKEGTNAKFLIPDYRSTGFGVHWLERYIRDAFEFEAGVRFDRRQLTPLLFDDASNLREPVYTFNNLTATVGALVHLNDHFSIGTNVATAWRPPHVSELLSNGLHHGAASIEEGLLFKDGVLLDDFESQQIDSEQAVKWVSSLKYKKGNVQLELSPYLNHIQNYIYLRPAGTRLTIRGGFPVFNYVQTDARFVGVDLNLGYNISDHVTYRGKGSYIRAVDVTEDDVLIFIPANNFSNEIVFKYSKLAGSIAKPYISIEAATTMRQNRAPSALFDFDTSEVPESIFDFKEAPDGYTIINLSMGFEWVIGRQKVSVILGVQNMLNVSYRDYLNRFRYYADDLGRNFNIRFNYKF